MDDDIVPANITPEGKLFVPAIAPWRGTPDERMELGECVNRNMPGCGNPSGYDCHVHADPYDAAPGRTVDFHLCRKHAFLAEKDVGVTHTIYRTDRLLFARRMRDHWMAQEGLLQHCTRCNAIYRVSHPCVADPAAIKGPEKLPW